MGPVLLLCAIKVTFPKERDLKSNIRTATKRTEKTVKMWNMTIDPKTGYHSYHLNPLFSRITKRVEKRKK